MSMSLSMSMTMSLSMSSKGFNRRHQSKQGRPSLPAQGDRRDHLHEREEVRTQSPSFWWETSSVPYPTSMHFPTASSIGIPSRSSAAGAPQYPSIGNKLPPVSTRNGVMSSIGPSATTPTRNVPSTLRPSTTTTTPDSSSTAQAPAISGSSAPVFGPSTYSWFPTLVSPGLSVQPIISIAQPSTPHSILKSTAPSEQVSGLSDRTTSPTLFPLQPSAQGRVSPLITEQPSIASGNDDQVVASDGHYTFFPTIGPTSSDILLPTNSVPSFPAPTSSTFPQQCQTISGVYGSLDGTRVGVSFGYELETVSVGEEELLFEVLPALEVAFSDYLLPFIDPGRCAAVSSRRLFLYSNTNEQSDMLEVIGISSRPDDLRVNSCSELSVPDDKCSIFRGELSLYVIDIAANSAVVAATRENLIVGFENGAFNDADERIVRVSFVDLSQREPANPIESEEEPPGNATGGSSNTILIAVVTIVAAIVLLLLGAAVMYRRRSDSVDTHRRQFEVMADDDADHMIDTGSDMGIPDQIALESIKEEKPALDDSDAELGSERQEDSQPFVTEVSSLYLEQQADGELVVKTTCPTASIFSESDDAADRISPSDSSVYMEGPDNASFGKERMMSPHSLANSDQDSQHSQLLI